MPEEKLFAKSLVELVSEVESTIPHAQKNGYLGVSAGMSLDVARELIEAVKYYQDHINPNKGLAMQFWCEQCDDVTEHDDEFISDVDARPDTFSDVKLTCKTCETVQWSCHDIYDVHVCSSSGERCYCDDTSHKHCDVCDRKCETDPTFEP